MTAPAISRVRPASTDMGGGGRAGAFDSDTSQRAGLLDSNGDVDVDDSDFDVGGDFGGDGGSDSA